MRFETGMIPSQRAFPTVVSRASDRSVPQSQTARLTSRGKSTTALAFWEPDAGMNSETLSPTGDRVKVEMADGVAEVTLNRPDKLNALDPAMFEAIIAGGESLSRMAGLRAVVLAGAGKGFCAGLDKETFASIAAGSAVPTLRDLAKRTHGVANDFQQAAYVWRTLPVPVIAAIHGPALGGGFQIALGADIRYVAPDARLSILEIKWGLVPDMAGIALMRELARSDVIRELAMTGRVFSGAEALAHGFATSVHADPLAAARATAREIAGRSPDAVRALKRLLNMASDADAAAILLAESKEQSALIGSPNQVEAVRAGVEGRAGRFADEG
jgi:enoyl-CoA hydratase/carnithine racemase